MPTYVYFPIALLARNALDRPLVENRVGSRPEAMSINSGRVVVITDFEGEVYPEQTAVACAWCRMWFGGKPHGIPVKKDGPRYVCRYIFCRPNCAVAFLDDDAKKYPQHRRIDDHNRARLLLGEIYGTEIKPSPDWNLLQFVGTGNATYEQFLTCLGEVRSDAVIRIPGKTYYTLS